MCSSLSRNINEHTNTLFVTVGKRQVKDRKYNEVDSAVDSPKNEFGFFLLFYSSQQKTNRSFTLRENRRRAYNLSRFF